jgi:hypothetical protein
MRVKARRLRLLGRNLPANADGSPPVSGELRVAAERDHELGRQVVRARLLDLNQGTRADLLPDLSDVQLLWAEKGQMRLTGVERVEGISFAQTWAVEVQP